MEAGEAAERRSRPSGARGQSCGMSSEPRTSSFIGASVTAPDEDGENGRPCHYLMRRLVGFLLLHILAGMANVAVIVDFYFGDNYLMILAMVPPILLSGVVCTHAAWHAEPAQLQWPWGLPLREQPPILRVLLSIPLGLLQGVIVLLAWDQYLERRNHLETGTEKDKEKWNRYHCKAVSSLCEGLPVLSVLFYAWWRMNFPADHPVIRKTWEMEQCFLGLLAMVIFLSCGSGIVELDFCCSKTVSKSMKKSTWYQFLHLIFRVSEFVSRTLLQTSFIALTRWAVWWWWCPFIIGNILFQFLIVLKHGGDETRRLVRHLCCYSCTWVNIFFFVDSPYKRRAARKITFWFDLRNLMENLVLPPLAYLATSGTKEDDLADMVVKVHPPLFRLWILCVLCQIGLRIYMWRVCRQMNLMDIYTPSEDGDEEKVQEVMNALVKEVRELTRAASADIDLNRPDAGGDTPLMLAARNGHKKVCEFLMHRGAFASIPKQESQGCRSSMFRCSQRGSAWTAVHMASWHNHAAVIKVLVKNGASSEDSQYLDGRGDTPLHVAARAGAVQAAKVLMAHWPSWRLALNAENKRPQDLAKFQKLRDLLQPESSFFDPNLDPPSFSSRIALTAPRTSSFNEVWLSVPLHISRKRVHLVAPGICSYVAASCGGALGRLCLSTSQDQPEREEDLALSDLVPIDRMGNQVSLMEALIGEGAFGQVFRAKHRQRDNLYAVKTFKTPRHAPASPEAARECDVGTLIHQTPHPCIVRLYMVTFDEDSGQYTLVMEFCPSNLFQRVHSASLQGRMTNGYQPPAQTLDWLGQIFLGLEHMHKRLNILFRDLKPGNVILDSAQCAKLADFGSTRVGPSAGTYSFGHPAGTVGYCAPEVLGGMPHDERADLYSLGVLTWLLFTGGMPGSAQPPVQPRPEVHQHLYDWLLLRKCLEDNFPPFQMASPDVPQQAADARNCVHLLVQPPEQRMRHCNLRQHALLAPLQLPSYDAGPTQVESWLEKRGFAKGQR